MPTRTSAAVVLQPESDVLEIDTMEWIATMRELRAVRPLATFLVLRQAGAMKIVRAHAAKQRHLALQQGLALECTRCGASCSIDLDEMTAHGDLVRPVRCGDSR